MPSRRKKKCRRPFGDEFDFVVCRHCHRPFGAISYAHLVHIHGYDPEHPIEEYKRRFRLSRAVSRRALKRSRSSISEYLTRTGKRWTKERVRREILSCSKHGEPLNYAAMNKDHRTLVYEAQRLFGSWKRTVEACGISYEAIRVVRSWSGRKIIEEIKWVSRKRQGLNYGQMEKDNQPLLQAAVRRFGSWADALKAAGIDPAKARKTRKWSREEIIQTIRRFDRIPCAKEVAGAQPNLYAATCWYFGGWPQAVKSAGYPYTRKKFVRRWSKERILDEIRVRSRKGLSLQPRIVGRELGGLMGAARREFGKWPEAVRQAGVEYPYQTRTQRPLAMK